METEPAIDNRLWQEFADQGWLGLHIDEQYTKLGLGTVNLAILAEEFGRACVPGPWLVTIWGVTLLDAIGGAVATDLLAKTIGGTSRIAVGALEETGAWNLCADIMETTLENGTLNGHKQLVQHAGQADQLLFPVRVDDKIGLVIVPTSAHGISIEKTPGIDATRTLYQVDFTGVSVADEQLLVCGPEAEGAWEEALQTMFVVAAAEMLGLQQWMLEETVEYVKTRRQFDRSIGSFQAVQYKCAEILQLTESARAAAWGVAAGTDDVAQAVSVAKAYTSDSARRTGNLSVQAHGGIGFTWEHDLHLYYKRAKADEVLFGDASFHHKNLGVAALAE